MTAREDFRAAVREAERSGCLFTEGQVRAIFRAGDAYVTAALLALAAELEAGADDIEAVAGASWWTRAVLESTVISGDSETAVKVFRRAAQMARSRAANPGLVSADSPPPSASVLRRLSATEDECLEAGP